jgi:hypothetical protein
MRLAVAVAAGILVAVSTLGGYLLGHDAATSQAEADRVRAEARDATSSNAERLAFDRASEAAERKAEIKGRRVGLAAGTKSGGKDGEAYVAAQQAEAAAAAEAEAAAAAADPCAPGNGHGDNNVPGSYISPELGYCVPPDGIEPYPPGELGE